MSQSDYTRTQFSEKYIQERVTEELRKAEKKSSDAFRDVISKLANPAANPDDPNDKLHATEIKQKLDEIKDKLATRSARGKLDEETGKAREAVINCFNNNQGKPLKCWAEVQEFKARVKAVEDAAF